ncbi:MAG: DUF309 domain-containing protein [Deltaproteobacteria bacterium]|nr:DUF309 domain-containing protein [Deltaproteobacteria bacterium]
MWPFSSKRPRFAPDRAFPAYAHLPGTTPHPFREPEGHSYGQSEPEPPPLDVDRAEDAEDYLFGFDLLNYGYFWEAHTYWEGLWHAAGREGPVADLLKALIRIAAAGVKGRQGVNGGVRSHMSTAAELLRGVKTTTGRDTMAGIGLGDLAEHCEGVAADTPDGGPHPDLDGARWDWTIKPRW